MMNINPYILLGIGIAFAVLYAGVITIGWAITRRNRRIIRSTDGISRVAAKVLDSKINDAPQWVETVSLQNNIFKTAEGEFIDIADYEPFIAVGESAEYPGVESGDLMLFDKEGSMKYVFTLPDISCYR